MYFSIYHYLKLIMKCNFKFHGVLAMCFAITFGAYAQKPPLNHDVYDGWQSLGSATISKDGKVVYYVVSPQEGDGVLTIMDVVKNSTIGQVPRATSVQFSPAGKHLAMIIKPKHAETRQARIEKKRGDDMPKDTLGIFSLASGNVVKVPAAKGYKLPEKQGNYIVYLADQEVKEEAKPAAETTAASEEARPARGGARPGAGAPQGGNGAANARKKTETMLFVYHFENGVDTAFNRVDSYFISNNGEDLFFVRKPADKDTVGADAGIVHYHIPSKSGKLISSGKGSYKQLSFSDDESQLIFLAYKGSDKVQNKIHQVYHYKIGR
jgi:hypothetical protein